MNNPSRKFHLFIFSKRPQILLTKQPVPVSPNLSGTSSKITKVSVVEIKRCISNEIKKVEALLMKLVTRSKESDTIVVTLSIPQGDDFDK